MYIQSNWQVNAIVRLTHTRGRDSQDQKLLLAHSADNKTRNYDKDLSMSWIKNSFKNTFIE